MKYIIILMLAWQCAYAQSLSYYSVLTNMVTALHEPNGTVSTSHTNQLVDSGMSFSNEIHRININLVYAISLVDICERDLSGDVLLPQAISICSNILTSSHINSNAWQKGVAGIVLSNIYSFDGKRLEAYSIMTNNNVFSSYVISNGEDSYLWNGIAEHLKIDGLSVIDAIRCYTAVSKINIGSKSDISSYTNGLPQTILIKLTDLINL